MAEVRGTVPIADRVPAQLFIVGSALVQYIGAAIAVGLFAAMSPASVAWWRVTVAAAFDFGAHRGNLIVKLGR